MNNSILWIKEDYAPLPANLKELEKLIRSNLNDTKNNEIQNDLNKLLDYILKTKTLILIKKKKT